MRLMLKLQKFWAPIDRVVIDEDFRKLNLYVKRHRYRLVDWIIPSLRYRLVESLVFESAQDTLNALDYLSNCLSTVIQQGDDGIIVEITESNGFIQCGVIVKPVNTLEK